jgi:hypothetical protein
LTPDTVDTTRLGQLAAELMDRIAEEYAEADGTPTLGIVAVVAEVNVDRDDGTGWTSVDYRCSDSRRWVQVGLFDAAKRAVLHSAEDEDD